MRFLILAILIFAGPAHAQAPFTFQTPLSIVISPDFPEPQGQVTARLTSPNLDLKGATIDWTVNGEEAGVGASISFATGRAGSTVSIQATAIVDGIAYRAERSIAPASVDVVWSATTFTPPLFPGRALATPGSRVRLEALPRFVSGNQAVGPSELFYTWYRDDALLEEQSGKGRNSIELEAPLLFSNDIIAVEVATQDRRLSARGTTRIAATDPLLILYENHPIFGLRTHAALGTSIIPDLETTVTALPFYAATPPRDSSMLYEWTVNGSRIATDENHPNSLTINAANSSGKATISLFVSHKSNIFFGARGRWDLTLRSGTDITDPFFSPRTSL